MSKVTYKEVWETLSKYDVNEHTEKKGSHGSFQATYLSWAWAWGIMMKHYPHMQLQFTQYVVSANTEEMTDILMYENRTCQVECTVKIDDVSRTMWLAVMDNKFKAIVSPTSTQINTAKQRCMVKCFAMLGLGHYIYAGEDLPQTDDESPKAKSKPKPKAKPKPKKVEEPKEDFSKLENVLTDVLDKVAEKDEREMMLGFLRNEENMASLNDESKEQLNNFIEKSGNQSTEIIEQWYDRLKIVVDEQKENK